jgi:predicted Fe-Mo cluster-binding NifX family protein
MSHVTSATGIGARMVICLAVAGDGCIDPRWGRAQRVAIATAEKGAITGWEEFDVSWDTLHDTGSEGTHHARVARFLREHQVDTVLAHHMGEGMARMLGKMGVTVHLGLVGDARRAVTAAAV